MNYSRFDGLSFFVFLFIKNANDCHFFSENLLKKLKIKVITQFKFILDRFYIFKLLLIRLPKFYIRNTILKLNYFKKLINNTFFFISRRVTTFHLFSVISRPFSRLSMGCHGMSLVVTRFPGKRVVLQRSGHHCIIKYISNIYSYPPKKYHFLTF